MTDVALTVGRFLGERDTPYYSTSELLYVCTAIEHLHLWFRPSAAMLRALQASASAFAHAVPEPAQIA